MVCSEFYKLLDNYENLTETELSELNGHSAECENCRNEFEFFKSITNTVSALPCPEPPGDLIAKVNKQLDAMPAAAGKFSVLIGNVKRNAYRYATAAACLAVGLVVGLNSKTINESLTDKDADGVISTTTITEKASEEPTPANTAEAIEASVPEAEKKDTVAVKKNEQKKARNNVKSAAAKKSSSAIKQEKNNKAVTALKSEKSSAAAVEKIPATIAPVETEVAEPTVEPVEQIEKSKDRKSTYTIARGVYHIPDSEKSVATEAPVDSVESYSLASGEYRIALGYYDVPEDSVQKIKTEEFTEQLIVSVQDVGTITSYMSTLGAMNSGAGYQMSLANFYELLTKMDTEGISYRYSSGVNTSDTIIFSIVTY